MPLFRLDSRSLAFPSPNLADADGLLAIGGDFHPDRLLSAYSQGIFPWMVSHGQPVWFSPDPRMVLLPRALHVPRSLGKLIRRGDLDVRVDTCFPEVLRHCAAIARPGQEGSWISEPYIESLLILHERGFAHSFEAFRANTLVGGLYGLAIGQAFFGESMFALEADASKVAFAHAARHLAFWGYQLIDCQQETPHLARFGASPWPRARFLSALTAAVAAPGRALPWTLLRDHWDGRTDATPFQA